MMVLDVYDGYNEVLQVQDLNDIYDLCTVEETLLYLCMK